MLFQVAYIISYDTWHLILQQVLRTRTAHTYLVIAACGLVHVYNILWFDATICAVQCQY